MFSVDAIAGAVKWVLIASVVGGLTWFSLQTIKRAHDADVLEAQLVAAKQSAQAMNEFAAKVEGVRAEAAARFTDFNQRLEELGAQRREKIIERLPANTRNCVDLDVVRLLNAGDSSEAGLPAPARRPDDARAPVTAVAGTGLR
jgi:hypothetical protein